MSNPVVKCVHRQIALSVTWLTAEMAFKFLISLSVLIFSPLKCRHLGFFTLLEYSYKGTTKTALQHSDTLAAPSTVTHTHTWQHVLALACKQQHWCSDTESAWDKTGYLPLLPAPFSLTANEDALCSWVRAGMCRQPATGGGVSPWAQKCVCSPVCAHSEKRTWQSEERTVCRHASEHQAKAWQARRNEK